MIQSIDFTKPVYNAVNINIRKPEVNADKKVTDPMEVNFDNGIYNAVKIDIDRPRVNTQPQQIYDYPEYKEMVTYGMLNLQPIALPEVKETETNDSTETSDVLPEETNVASEADEAPEADETQETQEVAIPEPNYTTIEAEKVPDAEETVSDAAIVSFHGAEIAKKKPEIIPSEDILPDIDIAQVTANLSSYDKDVQALQMEEITRLYETDKKLAKDFVVSDVITNLIEITKEDDSNLALPTKEQDEIRKKYMINWATLQQNPDLKDNLPYKLTDKEIAYALQLTPFELVERNKEYALTSLGALADLFIEDYKEKEGTVLPITDTPGVAAIVEALKKSPNAGVKLAAIDALGTIARPEYKKELESIFTIVAADKDPVVSLTAARALAQLKQIS